MSRVLYIFVDDGGVPAIHPFVPGRFNVRYTRGGHLPTGTKSP